MLGALVVTLAVAAPVLRHEVRATLDVPAHRLDATDVVRFAAPAHGEPVRFLLNESLEVRRIVAEPGGEPIDWRASDGWDPRHFWSRPPYDELQAFEPAREVEVPPPASGWSGGVVTLTVEYGGVVADSLHEPEESYGRSFETTSGRIVDQGAYLGGGTFWVPWSGDALFAFDLAVESPPDWRVVSQGELHSDTVEGGRRRARWICSEPAAEIWMIAGPYELREREHRGVRVMAYTYGTTPAETVEPYLASTGPILDRFAALFGDYPYSKFALVENYWQTGFGMPSFTLLGDRVIRLPFIVDTSYPHEILHNWWGNGVYVPRGEGNWCEGLTTYCADYAAKEREGEAVARDYRRSTLQGYRDFAAAGGKDFPLRGFRERDNAATQAVGYGKTLMVFHMLRRSAGDERFFAALRTFWTRHRFRYAGWNDLRAAFEEQLDADLAPFFGQWVDRAGAPVLRLDRAASVPDGVALFRVTGAVLQSEPTFALSVPVVVQGERERLGIDVECGGPETEFEVAVPFVPWRVAVDPDFETFRILHAEEVPPALSGILGAARTRIVLGADAVGEVREALVAVAADWARDSTFTVVEERAGEPLGEFDGGTWFLGEGEAARRLGGRLAQVERAAGTSIVAADRVTAAGRAAAPAGFFLPGSADAVAAVARKTPHYSKYSWLVFEGDRNVGKGLWEAEASPLTVDLK
ncbi:MAG: M1 family metallopeptidase [Candidatus Eiseniibacteriota bacterium]